ncbi:amino acid ABC transporter substrate-binding protein [Pseudodesulfovibrio sp. zrk46]|nr:amino acid ABC transporter substrate-binding protein [Pseudodesulfovibrio sp. zrk46]
MLEGRIDFVTQTDIVGSQVIHQLCPKEQKRIVITPMDMAPLSNCLMVGNKTDGAKEFIARFNEGLEAIRANGKLSAIYKKYHVE